MSTLRDYLIQKRSALLARRERSKERQAAGQAGPNELRAVVTAEGRSGIRRIRIREHQIISDSPFDFAGYNLGPGSPELQMGILGSCVTHIFLIQAADRQIPLDSLEVEVRGYTDARRGQPGFENVPIYPHNIQYTVKITSPASREEIDELHRLVEANCPILNLLRAPQVITGRIELTAPEDAVPQSSAA